jgi:hypothetical protein
MIIGRNKKCLIRNFISINTQNKNTRMLGGALRAKMGQLLTIPISYF